MSSVLRPGLDQCRETGIELGPESRVLVMLDDGGVGSSLVKKLEGLGVDVLAVDGAPSAEDLIDRVEKWRAADPVQGIYWLPGLDVEDPVTDMDLAAWREALRVRVKLLYALLRHLYDDIGRPATFLVSATRLGGNHGYDSSGATAPMGGGVVGITKTFKRERPDALVKAVDFAPSRKTAALADVLIAETERDPGVVEVGRPDDDRRITVALQETGLPEPATGMELGTDSVFVVTGAAGSIVSAIVADLARVSGGTFHLLDLAPEPDADDPDLAVFATDVDGLKRDIFERLQRTEERATPAMVDKELAAIERRQAALSAIRAVEAAGGTAHYHSVDLRDGGAVAVVTDAIAAHGAVDVLIHAAGLEVSRLLPDKEPAEFDLVFDVKADGWFNLLRGLADSPIGASVVFSSIAGRFGNAGQTDYSAANDLLCKSTSGLGSTRPDTIGLAVDWTAWGDIGMATRGSIPTVMRAAGIDMLPAAAGIPFIRRELIADGTTRELVVAGRLGVLTEEWDEAGGLDLRADGPVGSRVGPQQAAMITGVSADTLADGLVATARLDPAAEPFLADHRIDGTPVLPGVMGVEAFAEVARLLHPERVVTAIEDIDFLAPFKFYRDEPRELKVVARFTLDGDDILARCRMVGERTLATSDEPQVTVHFTATVRLSAEANDAAGRDPTPPGATVVPAADIYRIYFHGPAYQVLAEAWPTAAGAAGRLVDSLPPDHSAPAATVTDPRLVELCFQTAGVLEIATTAAMALPSHIDRLVLRSRLEAATGPVQALVHPTGDGGFDAAVVDGDGNVLLELGGYRTIELPGGLDDELVAPLRDGMATAT